MRRRWAQGTRRSSFRSIRSSSSIWGRASSSLLALLLTVGAARAQDDWPTYREAGVTLRVPAASPSPGRLLSTLVDLRDEVARHLGGVDAPPEIIVYVARTETEFGALTQHRIPHWGAGVAYPQAMTIVLRRTGPYESLLQTARHEFSHILLHHAVSSTGRRPPVWFNEGLAMWVAREWRLSQSLEVAAAAIRGGLIPLGEIDAVLSFGAGRAHLAYDQSYLAVLYLIDRGGEDAVPTIVSELAGGTPFDVALYRVTGLSPAAFEEGYATYVAARFGLVSLLTAEEAIWVYIVMLVLLVYVGVRVRNRRTLARWEEEDPLEGLPLRLQAKIKRERNP